MTMGPLAVLAGSGKITNIGVRKRFSVCHFVNAHPRHAEQFVCFVFAKRHIILGRTGYHTGTASGAFVQIDHHSKLFGFIVFHLYLIA
jgi:hypothetical protein